MKRTLAALLLLCALTGKAQTAAPCNGLTLRANLVRWLTLTPNLGVACRVASRWEAAADYTWGDYTFRGGTRRYALSELTAELRHYYDRRGRAYAGIYTVTGQFNYKLSATGRQGDHFGVGLSAGYQLPLSRRWQLDLGAAAGWLHVSKGERYNHQDGLEVWREDFTRSGLSPLGLRASLVYTFPKKGGGR